MKPKSLQSNKVLHASFINSLILPNSVECYLNTYNVFNMQKVTLRREGI